MASSQFPILRTPEQPQQSRVQDGIASVVNPAVKALQNTPIMGAPPPAWIRPDLLNGWVNYGNACEVIAFHRDALGYVHAKGVLINNTGGALAAVIMLFPKAHRPAFTQRFAVMGDAGTSQAISVFATGFAQPIVAVPNGGTCDFAFTFLAEH